MSSSRDALRKNAITCPVRGAIFFQPVIGVTQSAVLKPNDSDCCGHEFEKDVLLELEKKPEAAKCPIS